LQVGDVGAARVRVARAVARSSQGVEVRTPKSRKGRDVPVPAFVLEMLPVAGRGSGEWLFTGVEGGRVNVANWRRRVFQPAARAAGLGELNPHALRHTAASLAIAAGGDVLAVQRMLGHGSATTTLRLYSHLFDAQLDVIAERMEAGRSAALANVVPMKRRAL
jgi:integrase